MYYLAEIVTNKIETQLGKDIIDVQPISGGDINDARLIKTQDDCLYFVKVNDGTAAYGILNAEAKGLSVLGEVLPKALQIPKVISCEQAGELAYLLMEYLPNQAPGTGFWESFGKGLAKLHQPAQAYFGLDHDNYIGRLPQANQQQERWSDFYANQRLLPQAKLAYQQQLFDLKDMQHLENLCRRLEEIYPTETASLIHGDLWNGNYLVHSSGAAVLIDPSVSFSHREMDLAMSKLFGGFPPEFYEAYQAIYPLSPGWEDRLSIGQLYYLLVHLNMFGNSYLPAVKRIVKPF